MKSNLKKLRKEAGLSLDKLGLMCGGKTRGQMFGFEGDNANPTLKNAYVIAAVLDKRVEDIWPNTVEIVEEETTIRKIKSS